MWGIFLNRDNENIQELHVAPQKKDNIIDTYHIIDKSCRCQPVLERQDNESEIWIHNQLN